MKGILFLKNYYFYKEGLPDTYWKVQAVDEEQAWSILDDGERETEFMGLAGMDDGDIEETMIIHTV